VATLGENFDYKSVMMYDEYAFSKVRIHYYAAFPRLEYLTNAPKSFALHKKPNRTLS
jgi:hypothetical protein